MQYNEILSELDLRTYRFDETDNRFVSIGLNGEANFDIYDSTSETIKLVRYLITNRISFEEDLNGNIKLI